MLVGLLAMASGASIARAQSEGPDRKVTYSHQTMGTVISLTMWTDDEKLAAKASRAAFDEFDRIDAIMSSWKKGSDVAAINAAAGNKPTVVSSEVFDVIAKAQKMSAVSKGAFDITVGSYRGLWKFDEDRDGSIPSDADVNERRKLVGYRNVRLGRKKKSVQLRKPGQRITLGGIAKGHAVDRAVVLLHAAGVLDFIVQAGGDLYASGNKGGKKWTVGIRDPRGSPDASFAITAIENRTFSTSGDYERAVVVDGVRYHHLLDPKSGRPAKGARSVTVMAKDAITADMWSTALFVLGTKRGLALANRTKGIEAVFVDTDNKVRTTRGFKTLTAAELKKSPRKDLDGIIMLLKDPTPGI